MPSRKDRGTVDEETGEVAKSAIDEGTVTEDTLGGLPRSNYHERDFAADIQAMPSSEIGRILDKFPYTKRGFDK